MTWSPRCPKCGGRGRADASPPANMIFAGRLRPDATKPWVAGMRVRCSKCNRWFVLGTGTEWRENPAGAPAYIPEPAPEQNAAEGDDETPTGKD